MPAVSDGQRLGVPLRSQHGRSRRPAARPARRVAAGLLAGAVPAFLLAAPALSGAEIPGQPLLAVQHLLRRDRAGVLAVVHARPEPHRLLRGRLDRRDLRPQRGPDHRPLRCRAPAALHPARPGRPLQVQQSLAELQQPRLPVQQPDAGQHVLDPGFGRADLGPATRRSPCGCTPTARYGWSASRPAPCTSCS